MSTIQEFIESEITSLSYSEMDCKSHTGVLTTPEDAIKEACQFPYSKTREGRDYGRFVIQYHEESDKDVQGFPRTSIQVWKGSFDHPVFEPQDKSDRVGYNVIEWSANAPEDVEDFGEFDFSTLEGALWNDPEQQEEYDRMMQVREDGGSRA